MQWVFAGFDDIRINSQVIADVKIRMRIAPFLPTVAREMVQGISGRAANIRVGLDIVFGVECGVRISSLVRTMGHVVSEQIARVIRKIGRRHPVIGLVEKATRP